MQTARYTIPNPKMELRVLYGRDTTRTCSLVRYVRGQVAVLSSKPVGRRGSVFLGFLYKGDLSSLLSNT